MPSTASIGPGAISPTRHGGLDDFSQQQIVFWHFGCEVFHDYCIVFIIVCHLENCILQLSATM